MGTHAEREQVSARHFRSKAGIYKVVVYMLYRLKVLKPLFVGLRDFIGITRVACVYESTPPAASEGTDENFFCREIFSLLLQRDHSFAGYSRRRVSAAGDGSRGASCTFLGGHTVVPDRHLSCRSESSSRRPPAPTPWRGWRTVRPHEDFVS